MFNFVSCTSSTGGTGALTTARAGGLPLPTDVLGVSGSRRVEYNIVEWDSARSSVVQAEEGRGVLNLSTGVLTRDEVHTTWVSSGNTYLSTGATPLNFGSTAANIDIMLNAKSGSLRPALPSVPVMSGAITDSYAPFNNRIIVDSNSGGVALTAGRRMYIPSEFIFGKPITTLAVNATSIATTGNVRLSVYDWGSDGGPGNLIKEFTSAAQIAVNTATGAKSITPANPLFLPSGWYWFMLQADAAIQLLFANPATNMGAGITNSRDVMYLYKDATYGAAPASADSLATMSGATTRSSGGQPLVMVK